LVSSPTCHTYHTGWLVLGFYHLPIPRSYSSPLPHLPLTHTLQLVPHGFTLVWITTLPGCTQFLHVYGYTTHHVTYYGLHMTGMDTPGSFPRTHDYHAFPWLDYLRCVYHVWVWLQFPTVLDSQFQFVAGYAHVPHRIWIGTTHCPPHVLPALGGVWVVRLRCTLRCWVGTLGRCSSSYIVLHTCPTPHTDHTHPTPHCSSLPGFWIIWFLHATQFHTVATPYTHTCRSTSWLDLVGSWVDSLPVYVKITTVWVILVGTLLGGRVITSVQWY